MLNKRILLLPIRQCVCVRVCIVYTHTHAHTRTHTSFWIHSNLFWGILYLTFFIAEVFDWYSSLTRLLLCHPYVKLLWTWSSPSSDRDHHSSVSVIWIPVSVLLALAAMTTNVTFPHMRRLLICFYSSPVIGHFYDFIRVTDFYSRNKIMNKEQHRPDVGIVQ